MRLVYWSQPVTFWMLSHITKWIRPDVIDNLCWGKLIAAGHSWLKSNDPALLESPCKERFCCTSLKRQGTKMAILFVLVFTQNLRLEALTRRIKLSTDSRSVVGIHLKGAVIILLRCSFPSKMCWGKPRAHYFRTSSSQTAQGTEAYSSSSLPWIQDASRDSSRKEIKQWKQLTPHHILRESLQFHDWPQNEVVKINS